MSTTRLLLIGAVKIFQPVHGYLIRRELMTWRVDEWAHLHPGSVYNGLRSLAQDGYIEAVDTSAEGARPIRTTYRLTADGEIYFLRLLRESLWSYDPFNNASIQAGLAMMTFLTREEVLVAMEHRLGLLEGFINSSGYVIETMRKSSATPDHVVEQFLMLIGRAGGEVAWTKDFVGRLRDGDYAFSGEPADAFHVSGASRPDRRVEPT